MEAERLISEPTDELSFVYDVWETVRNGWRWIAGGAILAAAAAAIWLATAPVQYEATGVLRIGQTLQPGQFFAGGQGGTLVPVEAPSRIVERLLLPSFTERIAQQLGWDESDDPRRRALQDSLKASVTRTDWVQLRVREPSRDDATRALSAVVQSLAEFHRGLAQPVLDGVSAELAAAEKEERDIAKDISRLTSNASRLEATLPPHERFSESVLYQNLMLLNAQRLQESRHRSMQMRAWITVMQDQSTTGLIDVAGVSEKPVSPKRVQTLVLAFLGGSLAGLVVAMVRNSRRRRREAAAALG